MEIGEDKSKKARILSRRVTAAVAFDVASLLSVFAETSLPAELVP
jgi:hypothetical protein